MEDEELRELFCAKISLEIRRFKENILQKDNESVYGNAFRIDGMINIYELLLEMSRKIEDKTLRKLLVFPGLLAFLYGKWLKTEDSHTEELEACLKSGMEELEEKYQQIEKEEGAA